MLVHHRVTLSIKFPGVHMYTWVLRGTVRVKCFTQERNAMSPVRAQKPAARSGDERTNHEAKPPPIEVGYHILQRRSHIHQYEYRDEYFMKQ